MALTDRLQHAWNAFMNKNSEDDPSIYMYGGSYYRPDRPIMHSGTERSIVTAVYNRIAIDVAAVNIQHVRLDENGRFESVINSSLNRCLTLEANLDQTGRAFIQDATQSLLDEGCIALVPVDTSLDPKKTASFDIETLRVGKITEWFPDRVKVSIYNDKVGARQEVVLPKSFVGIVENPLYSVMNEPNSTLKRLIYKLNILDAIDKQSGSGKLDLIIQLPYVIRTEQKRKEAEKRRKDIEMQLAGSKYGIAYTDGTERVTQLNRPAENNLMSQITYLTSMLYGQLGITEEVVNGTADEKTMLNYYNRTIEPILSALTDEMKRKFLTKTARSQGQSIMFFRDPFRLMPVNEIANTADKLTRNEIMSSNEVRSKIGLKPVKDPRADELRNKNLNASDNALQNPVSVKDSEESENE